MLVAGNVIIGGKDESHDSDDKKVDDGVPSVVGGEFRDDDGGERSAAGEAEGVTGRYRDGDGDGDMDGDAATVDQLLARQLEKDDEEDVPHLGELDGYNRR